MDIIVSITALAYFVDMKKENTKLTFLAKDKS